MLLGIGDREGSYPMAKSSQMGGAQAILLSKGRENRRWDRKSKMKSNRRSKIGRGGVSVRVLPLSQENFIVQSQGFGHFRLDPFFLPIPLRSKIAIGGDSAGLGLSS